MLMFARFLDRGGNPDRSSGSPTLCNLCMDQQCVCSAPVCKIPADPNTRCNAGLWCRGLTPLQRAVSHGQSAVIGRLINSGARTDVKLNGLDLFDLCSTIWRFSNWEASFNALIDCCVPVTENNVETFRRLIDKGPIIMAARRWTVRAVWIRACLFVG